MIINRKKIIVIVFLIITIICFLFIFYDTTDRPWINLLISFYLFMVIILIAASSLSDIKSKIPPKLENRHLYQINESKKYNIIRRRRKRENIRHRRRKRENEIRMGMRESPTTVITENRIKRSTRSLLTPTIIKNPDKLHYKCKNCGQMLILEGLFCSSCGAHQPVCPICYEDAEPSDVGQNKMYIMACCETFIHLPHLQKSLENEKCCPICKATTIIVHPLHYK